MADTSESFGSRLLGGLADAAGYEEDLYETKDGKLFLYGKGGENSIYPTETIKRMSAAKAEEWKNA